MLDGRRVASRGETGGSTRVHVMMRSAQRWPTIRHAGLKGGDGGAGAG